MPSIFNKIKSLFTNETDAVQESRDTSLTQLNMEKPLNETPQIQELVANGQVAEALQRLIKKGNADMSFLQNRLGKAFQDWQKKEIDNETWTCIQNQITFGVLASLPQETKALLPISKEEIRKFIGNGNTEGTVQRMAITGNIEIQLLKNRYETTLFDFYRGFINFNELEIQQARINYAILETLPKETRQTTTVSMDEVYQLAHTQNLKAALDLFVQSGSDEAILLQARFNTAQNAKNMGLIRFNEWAHTQSQLNNALFGFNSKETTTKTPISEEKTTTKTIITDEIRQLLNKNKIEEALILLSKSETNAFFLLKSRFRELQHAKKLGIISFNQQADTLNQIKDDILKM